MALPTSKTCQMEDNMEYISDGIHSSISDDATGKRFIRVDSIYSPKDRQTRLFRTTGEPKSYNKLRRYAFVVKRNVSGKGIIASTHVEINSQYLSRALRDVFPDAKSLGLEKERPEVACETLWHASPALRHRLDQERKQSRARDDVMVSDIEAALDFVREEFETTTTRLAALQKKGQISFDLLWCLFPPLIEIYTDANALNEPQVLRCKSCSYQEDEKTGERWFAVESECLNHDGQRFGWSEQLLKIPLFKDTAHITSLLAYPLVYHPDQKGLRSRLQARGKTFVGLLEQPKCCGYGATGLMPRCVGSEWEEETLHIPGRVMVDPERFSKSGSSSDSLRKPSCSPHRSFPPQQTPDKDLMFCHYRIIGFSFDRKRWGALAVGRLRDPGWDAKALDRIMMPPVRRELLRSLVSAHWAKDQGQAPDSSGGKGRGLAGLLSGSPGVGKTLAAEAVAEVSGHPLYVVSAGDLGTDASDFDKRLGKVLAVASSWKCVLLVDQCDVFLGKREHAGLANNALASIFARRLECFQGLAILTATRMDDIDKALLSRLHFKFHYEDLGNKQRLALWKSSLGPVKGLDEKKLERIAAAYEVNGHEIKNAVHCANLIAQSRRVTLTANLVEEVLDEVSAPCNTINGTQELPAAAQKVSHPLPNGYCANVEKPSSTSHRVEGLTRNIQDNSRSFGANQALRLVPRNEVDKLDQGPGAVGPFVEENKGITFIYSGGGDLNIQFGNGDMFHVNSGGTVNKAERMSVGHTPASTK